MTRTFTLARSTPEAQGIPSSSITAFIEGAERQFDALHSFMLMRHGNIVAEGWWEPYRADDKHLLYSLSKSFTSSAIGLLVSEGRLSIDDPVLSFFPDEAPANPGDNLKAMKVRHLLAMSTGHETDTTDRMSMQPGKSWVEGFLSLPVERKPGTHFLYNTGATYMLSAIVQKLAGERMIDYLQPRLFEPLGIVDPDWEVSPEGIDVGGWGLSITTEDIAAFGHLYLRKGIWNGRRILPEAWIKEATSLQTPNGTDPNSDWQQGYGYQFWMCRHNAYRGDGAFGQYCVVMPDQDAVLAITSGLEDMQPVLDLAWKVLLPVMGPEPLPEDETGHNKLLSKLSALQLRTPEGNKHSPTATRISGKTFVMDKNGEGIEEITLDFGSDEVSVKLLTKAGEQRFSCGYERWVRGGASLEPAIHPFLASPRRDEPWDISASGAWTSDNSFRALLAFYKTPFVRSFTCHFDADKITIEQRINVSFGPLFGPKLTGTIKNTLQNQS